LYPYTDRSHVCIAPRVLGEGGKGLSAAKAEPLASTRLGDPELYDFALEYELIEALELEIAASASAKERALKEKQEFERKLAEEQKLRRFLQEEEDRRAKKEAELKREAERARVNEVVLDLTPVQRDALFEFRNVADCQDLETAKKFLLSYKWDSGMAMSAYFEFEGDVSKLKVAEDSLPPRPKTPVLPAEPVRPSSPAHVSVTMVLPSLVRIKREFSPSATLWDVYSFLTTESGKWDNRPFMIGNSDRLFKEEDLDKSLADVGMTREGTLFVKKF